MEKMKNTINSIANFIKMVFHPNDYIRKSAVEETTEKFINLLNLYEKALYREKEKDSIIRELTDISDINREVAKNIAKSEAELNKRFIVMSDMFDELYSTAKECIAKKNYKSLKDWVEEFENIEFSDEEWEEILGEVE